MGSLMRNFTQQRRLQASPAFLPTELGNPDFSLSTTPDSQAQFPAAAAEKRLFENQRRAGNALAAAQQMGFDTSSSEYDRLRVAQERGFLDRALTLGESLIGWVDGPRQFVNLAVQDFLHDNVEAGTEGPGFLDYWDALWGGIDPAEQEAFSARTGLDPVSGSQTLDLLGWDLQDEDTASYGARFWRGVGDFGLQILTDPLTYVTFGLAGVGKKAALGAVRSIQGEAVQEIIEHGVKKGLSGATLADDVFRRTGNTYYRSLAAQKDDLVEGLLEDLNKWERNFASGKDFDAPVGETFGEYVKTAFGQEFKGALPPDVEEAIARYLGGSDPKLIQENLAELAIARKIGQDIMVPVLNRNFAEIPEEVLEALPAYLRGGMRISIPFTQSTLKHGVMVPGTRGLGRRLLGDRVRNLHEAAKGWKGYASITSKMNDGLDSLDMMRPLLKGLQSGAIQPWQYHIAAPAIDTMYNRAAGEAITAQLNAKWSDIEGKAKIAGVENMEEVHTVLLNRLEGAAFTDAIVENLTYSKIVDGPGVTPGWFSDDKLNSAIKDMSTYIRQLFEEHHHRLSLLDPSIKERYISGYLPHVPTGPARNIVRQIADKGGAIEERLIKEAQREGNPAKALLAQIIAAQSQTGRLEKYLGASGYFQEREVGRLMALTLTNDGAMMLDEDMMRQTTKKLIDNGVLDPSAMSHKYIPINKLNELLAPEVEALADELGVALPGGWEKKLFNDNAVELVNGYVGSLQEAINIWGMVDGLKTSGLAFRHSTELDVHKTIEGIYSRFMKHTQRVNKKTSNAPKIKSKYATGLTDPETDVVEQNLALINRAIIGDIQAEDMRSLIGEARDMSDLHRDLIDDALGDVSMEDLTPEVIQEIFDTNVFSYGNVIESMVRNAQDQIADVMGEKIWDSGIWAELDRVLVPPEGYVRVGSDDVPIPGDMRAMELLDQVSASIREPSNAGKAQIVLDAPDEYVYHITTAKNAAKIRKDGLKSGGFVAFQGAKEGNWGQLKASFKDQDLVVLAVPRENLHPFQLRQIEKTGFYHGDNWPEGVAGVMPAAEIKHSGSGLATDLRRTARGEPYNIEPPMLRGFDKLGPNSVPVEVFGALVREGLPSEQGTMYLNKQLMDMVRSGRERFFEMRPTGAQAINSSDIPSGKLEPIVGLSFDDDLLQFTSNHNTLEELADNKAEAMVHLDERVKNGQFELTPDNIKRIIQSEQVDNMTADFLYDYLDMKLMSLPHPVIDFFSQEAAEIMDTRALYDQFEASMNDFLQRYSAIQGTTGELLTNTTLIKTVGDEQILTELQSIHKLARTLQEKGYGEIANIMKGVDVWTSLAENKAFTNPGHFGLAGPALEGLSLHRDMGKFIRNFARNSALMYTPEGIAAAKTAANEAYRWWRAMATISRPTFHIRNLTGGAWMNMLMGVGPEAYKDTALNVVKFRNALTKPREGITSPDDLIEAALNELPEHVRPAFKAAWSEDIFSGFVATEFRKLTSQQKNSRFAWAKVHDVDNFILTKLGANSMQGIEDLLRMSLFMQYFNPANPASSKAARDMVNAVHFDYVNLTPFETRIKSWIPFFVWTKNNLPRQLQLAIENPRTVQKYRAMMQSLNDNFGGNEETLPDADWYGAYAAGTSIKVNPNTPFWARAVIDPDLPIRDLLEVPMPGLGNMVEYGAGLLGPHISILSDVSEQREYNDVNAPMPFAAVLKTLAALGLYDETTSGDVRMSYLMRSAIETAFPFTREVTTPFFGGPNDPNRQQRLGIKEDDNALVGALKSATFTLAGGAGVNLATPADARGVAARSNEEIDKIIRELQLSGHLPASTP